MACPSDNLNSYDLLSLSEFKSEPSRPESFDLLNASVEWVNSKDIIMPDVEMVDVDTENLNPTLMANGKHQNALNGFYGIGANEAQNVTPDSAGNARRTGTDGSDRPNDTPNQNESGDGGRGSSGDGNGRDSPPNLPLFQEPMEQDDDSRPEATLRLTVQNISQLKDTVYSEPTYVRNLPWKIMAMNRQNEKMSRSLGFFLQCNGDSDSSSWSCEAKATMTLISQKPDCPNLDRTIEHHFFSKENDWGYVHFTSWPDLLNPEKGYVKDDTIYLQVHVQADAPHGVQWDSKKHTGYVGLKNQGATCYMNSLLQTLFFTNKLRKAVYQMPTESDDSTRSVALALQRVFYELQFNDKPVATKKLTKSFGWETFESLMQHDVQELCRVLLDNMESKMKGTCVEGTIPALFEGKMVSYIRCKHVDFSSTRVEPFYDIQLNIKGKKDIYESFDDYVAVELLDGENKYDAGEYGLQEAEKGIHFQTFPPVLHLHLLRFQYDPLTDTNVKINDRFEFLEKIDLSKYLKDGANSKEATYRLHAVLVHSGDNHGGHYVVFINPKGDGRWCKFDDDVVSKSTKEEAIDHNFGSSDDDVSVKHCTNAYMLVYIRDGSDVLQPVTEDDIPEQLVERLAEERRREELRRKERSEAHLYMQLHAFTECAFYGHVGFDLYDQEKTPFKLFKVEKEATLRSALEQLGTELNYPPEGIRLWPIVLNRHQIMRPAPITISDEMERTMETIAEKEPMLRVFLELVDPSSPSRTLSPFDKDRHVLVFLKYFDPCGPTLAYSGNILVDINERSNRLHAQLAEIVGLPSDASLRLYEEVRPDLLQPFEKPELTFKALLEDVSIGCIVVFERALPVSPSTDDTKIQTAADYYRDLSNRILVNFVDKSSPNDPGFVMELSKNMYYHQWAMAVAQHLGTESYLIQFFRAQNFREGTSTPIKCDFKGRLEEILPPTRHKSPRKLYYQPLTIHINELENKKAFKCIWVNSKLKEERELSLYPNKSGTVIDLLEEAKKMVDLSPTEGTGKLRLLEVISYKITQVFLEEALLECINTSNKTYRVEEIPRDELVLEQNEFLMPVAHFQKEPMHTFGTPFLLKIRPVRVFLSFFILFLIC